jgi:hypothetical protein
MGKKPSTVENVPRFKKDGGDIVVTIEVSDKMVFSYQVDVLSDDKPQRIIWGPITGNNRNSNVPVKVVIPDADVKKLPDKCWLRIIIMIAEETLNEGRYTITIEQNKARKVMKGVIKPPVTNYDVRVHLEIG